LIHSTQKRLGSIVDLLLKARADPNVVDDNGLTARGHAGLEVHSTSHGGWLRAKVLPRKTKPGFWCIEYVGSDGKLYRKDFQAGVPHPDLHGLPVPYASGYLQISRFPLNPSPGWKPHCPSDDVAGLGSEGMGADQGECGNPAGFAIKDQQAAGLQTMQQVASSAEDLARWRPDFDAWRAATATLNSMFVWACRAKSHAPIPLAMRLVKLFQLGIEPFLDIMVVILLLRAHDFYWASISACLLLIPTVVLYALFNYSTVLMRWKPGEFLAATEYSSEFKKVFGQTPDLHVFLTLFPQIAYEAVTTHGLSSRKHVFIKLRTLVDAFCEDLPHAVFKIYMQVRLKMLGRAKTVNPFLMTLSILSSSLNFYSALSYFTTYSKLAFAGNNWSLLEGLLLLGDGMAPPTVLEKLRVERDPRITADLSHINVHGLRSIGMALRSSTTAVTAEFSEGTGLEHVWKFLLLRHNGDENDAAGDWTQFFCVNASSNRGVLESIRFNPAIPVPAKAWRFDSHALALREVRNGSTTVYTNSRNRSSPTALWLAGGGGGTVIPPQSDTSDVVNEASWAARTNNWSSLATLLAYYREVLQPKLGSILLDAATEGSLDCVQLLLCQRASPISLERGLLALGQASAAGSFAVVKALLEAQATPRARNSHGNTPLHLTAFSNSASIAEHLIKANASPAAGNHANKTPLHTCCQEGAVNVIQVLAKCRADLNARDDAGLTAMQHAAHHNKADTIRVLVNERAQVDSQEPGLHDRIDTPLQIASCWGFSRSVRVLLWARANLDAQDRHGRTPLIHSTQKRLGSIVDLLLKARADPNVVDDNGLTARGHAGLEVHSTSHGGWLRAKVLPRKTKPGFWCIEYVGSDGKLYRKDFQAGVPHPDLHGLPVPYASGYLRISRFPLNPSTGGKPHCPSDDVAGLRTEGMGVDQGECGNPAGFAVNDQKAAGNGNGAGRGASGGDAAVCAGP